MSRTAVLSARVLPATVFPATAVATVAGRRIRYVDTGGDGPALLLLNGSGGNLELLMPLIDLLRRTRRIIAFDQPGMGGSPAAYPMLDIPALAELAAALLDACEVERADVLGYSFGGAIAQQLAMTRRTRVRRLVLVASVVGLGGLPTGPVTATSVIAHQFGSPAPHLTRAIARRGYGGRVRHDEPALRRAEWAWLAAPADPLSFVGQAVAVATWSSLALLWTLRAPTLVVTGDDDAIVPLLNALALALWIPQAQLRVVPGGGHLLPIDPPEELADLVEEFLPR